MNLSNLSRLGKQTLTLKHGVTQRNTPKELLCKARRPSRDRGFTLIEMLVVLAIIATLLVIGVGAIKNMSTSKGVETAVPLADSLFSQARLVAKSSGSPTRVVIYADTTGDNEDTRSRYLRMMGVATGRDATGLAVYDMADVTQWKLVSRPITLPSNTFFNADLSNKLAADIVTAVFPGSDTSKDCYYYQFNSEGALIDASTTSVTNGQFVVQAGKLRPGQDAPSVDKNATRDIGGFRIWANGRMAMFRSPNQIIDAADDPEF